MLEPTRQTGELYPSQQEPLLYIPSNKEPSRRWPNPIAPLRSIQLGIRGLIGLLLLLSWLFTTALIAYASWVGLLKGMELVDKFMR